MLTNNPWVTWNYERLSLITLTIQNRKVSDEIYFIHKLIASEAEHFFILSEKNIFYSRRHKIRSENLDPNITQDTKKTRKKKRRKK